MRAIVVREFGEPEVMKIEDIPSPQPGDGEVLVRIRAAGVNPVDAYIRTGTYARKPPLPYTPGSDGAGEVIGLGAGVTGLSIGDRVYVYVPSWAGTYAEQTVVPSNRVWPLPERLSFAQGAAIATPYATAYRAFYDKGQARPGEWLLVHGATGSVGSALVQLGAALGMRVIGTAGSADGRALVESLGAELVLDHNDPGHLDLALKQTVGHGIDLIVEQLANVNLGQDLPVLARNGRVVVVGSRAPVQINARDLMSRDASITALTLFNATDADLKRIHAGLGAGFRNGTLAPVVGKTVPLSEAAAAHRTVLSSRAHGKIALTP